MITASTKGHKDIVKYLLKQEEIDYNAKDEKGRTALMVAATDEIEELFLDEYGVITDLDCKGFKEVELIQAAFHGNLKKVESLLEKEGDYKNRIISSNIFWTFNTRRVSSRVWIPLLMRMLNEKKKWRKHDRSFCFK